MTARIWIALGFLVAASVASSSWAQDQCSPTARAGDASRGASPASVSHPARIRVGAGVAATQLIHVVQPQFHSDAKMKTSVALHAVIDFDGAIISLEFVSGPPTLKDPVMDAVRQWRYRPVALNGEPVQVDTMITVVIKTDKNGDLKPQPKPPKS